MSAILKTLVAGLATATVALAFAQGTPPNPAAANPATGAGQRSSQNTPMGTTGTPTGSGAAAQGSTGTGSAGNTAAMSAGSSAGASSGTVASDSMGSKSTTRHTRKARKHAVKADRG